MVRQPALEVISCLKKTDNSKPAVRYLFCILSNTRWHSHTHTQINILFFSWCFWINMLSTLTSCSDGLKGSGKTMSLCHAVHFCYTQGWLVLHIPDGETNTHRPGGWLQKYRMCQQWSSYFFSVFFFIIQLTSGWRTVMSCCPHPITPLALISRYKPSNGYATSKSPMNTSFQR